MHFDPRTSRPRASRLTRLALASCLFACSGEPERTLYTGGHADIALELVVVDEAATLDAYLSSHAATIGGDTVSGAVPLEQVAVWSSARFTRPVGDSGAFEGLCVPGGEQLGWLPQGLRDASSSEVPFLGISAAAEPGMLADDTVAISLVAVESPSGAGAFSLWRDGLPPKFFMSSCDGIDESDVLEIPVGHDHYNMGFSEPGKWSLTYEASARLNDGESMVAEFRVHYVLE